MIQEDKSPQLSEEHAAIVPQCLSADSILCLIKESLNANGHCWIAYADKRGMCDLAASLLQEQYLLEDISVIDVLEGYVVAYCFDHMAYAGRLSIRVLLPHDTPVIPSISHLYQGADWHEREAADFYGITFENHPNPVRLLLPSDMNVFPLRKNEKNRSSIQTVFSSPTAEFIKKAPSFTYFDPPAAEASPVPPDVAPDKTSSTTAIKGEV